MSSTLKNFRTKSEGFSLLEVLVALIILSFGLLGNASLQVSSLRSMHKVKSRNDVTYLAYDIADRMRANEVGTKAGHYTGTIQAYDTDCVGLANNCSAAEMAQADINDSNNLLSAIPGATASIADGGADSYTITIRWDEERTGVTGTDCFSGSDDDLRCFVLGVSL